jgi:hypothetical protein
VQPAAIGARGRRVDSHLGAILWRGWPRRRCQK